MLEMVFGMGLLSLLMAAILFIYITGAGAWAKADAQAELLDVLQTTSLKLSNELQRSCYDSLTVESGSLSCLSAEDPDTGRLKVDPATGQLRWQRYLVFYRDPGRNALMRRVVPFSGGLLPAPLGPTSLTGGEVLARTIHSITFEQVGSLVRFRLVAERKRPRREDPEHIEQTVLVKVRH